MSFAARMAPASGPVAISMTARMRLNSPPSIRLKTMQLKRSLGLGLFAAFLATTVPAADRTGNVAFGLTTTQEASRVSKAILTRLESAFPNLDLSYSVAGTSQQLRSLEDGLIPFAITHNSDKERALVERSGHLRIEAFANDFLLVVGPQATLWNERKRKSGNVSRSLPVPAWPSSQGATCPAPTSTNCRTGMPSGSIRRSCPVTRLDQAVRQAACAFARCGSAS